MPKEGTYYVIDPPVIHYGYSVDDFKGLVDCYVIIFKKQPLGHGYNPARAFAIDNAISTKNPVTQEDIDSFADKNDEYVYDPNSKSWLLSLGKSGNTRLAANAV